MVLWHITEIKQDKYTVEVKSIYSICLGKEKSIFTYTREYTECGVEDFMLNSAVTKLQASGNETQPGVFGSSFTA